MGLIDAPGECIGMHKLRHTERDKHLLTLYQGQNLSVYAKPTPANFHIHPQRQQALAGCWK
jgi:hypothetical protein